MSQTIRKKPVEFVCEFKRNLLFRLSASFFGLIGSSLGVRPHARTSRSQGFGISVLLIFAYYLMSFIFSSLGITGSLTPFLSAWLPVLIGLSAGVILLRQSSR